MANIIEKFDNEIKVEAQFNWGTRSILDDAQSSRLNQNNTTYYNWKVNDEGRNYLEPVLHPLEHRYYNCLGIQSKDLPLYLDY